MPRNERSAGFIIYSRPTDPADGDQSPQYLLLDYGRHWDFVKGHVESGEDDLTAAVRELKEETSLVDPAVIAGFRHEIVYFFRDKKKGLIRKTVTFFLAEVRNPEVVLSREHTGFEFLPYDAALRRVTFPTAKQVLRAAHQFLTTENVAATVATDEVTGGQPQRD